MCTLDLQPELSEGIVEYAAQAEDTGVEITGMDIRIFACSCLGRAKAIHVRGGKSHGVHVFANIATPPKVTIAKTVGL